jgi:MFS family permease
MFLLVFGIQEGHQYDWGTIKGIITVPALIVAGLLVLALFVFWQSRNKKEPLVPLSLFRDRNFSLANVGISTMGFAITAMAFPIMLYAQLVRGLTPTQSALLLVPMAIMSIVLAPFVGKLTDRVHPRLITGVGFTCTVISLVWLSEVMTPDSQTWEILLPMVLLGIGNACVWAPLSATATRNLPPQQAGAGAGVYNATRQVGAVLGSAAIAVAMDSRIAAQGLAFQPSQAGSGRPLPAVVLDAFSTAMAESILLPALVLLVGLVAVLFFQQSQRGPATAAAMTTPAAAVEEGQRTPY